MVYFDPAQALANAYEASSNRIQRPNESQEYRDARSSLLADEIELRRHIARVAAMRRDLPPGGEVTKNYEFVGEDGPLDLSEMFGEHDTLITYSFMYGPDRAQGCPSAPLK